MELVSETEIRQLQELRGRILDLKLSPELGQDKNLVRWLRARKCNINAAEQMIRKNHAWLKDKNMDDLVLSKNPFEWGQSQGDEFPLYVCGFDKDNNPVFAVPLGSWDVRSVLSAGKRSTFVAYASKTIELCWRACMTSSKGKPWMGQFVGIYDFKDLAFSQISSFEVIQVTIQIVQSFDENYPEILRKGFVVNAPYAFQLLFKLISPMLDERTLAKFSVLGSDPTVWRKEIGALVPVHQFPRKFGGDGDDDMKMTITADGSCILPDEPICKKTPAKN